MPSSTFVIRCLLLILSLLYAAEASKLQSNITIALIGPYSLLPGLNYHGFEVIGGLAQVNASRINPNSPQGVHYFDHIFGEMAIDDVNSNPTTFPNTTVLVRRFTDTTSSKAPPGGYAIALANYINDFHPDIIAIFGGYLSTTSKFEAEVYGAYNLPYAGSTQVAPLFSDKSNYPYFIRSAAVSYKNGMLGKPLLYSKAQTFSAPASRSKCLVLSKPTIFCFRLIST
ncbi:hypothetical protein BCR33DRAFT_317866 [Rhizoclosmatium globosum]|uniref:Receptor ligand binding region domain-containing protein n=1 Tax=Rhizoclosmatium globosum TaxID=329046 RepID=A0A1Y2CZF4_9FUNG|nr:hypothetical protein BCR33DRAFT_317866 [Rhizoclosmatium globosum]|eukprot:ORY52442.1 hypothetical protein BCR33DRAFT_317866 [Rhizoclosmatium globosum]